MGSMPKISVFFVSTVTLTACICLAPKTWRARTFGAYFGSGRVILYL